MQCGQFLVFDLYLALQQIDNLIGFCKLRLKIRAFVRPDVQVLFREGLIETAPGRTSRGLRHLAVCGCGQFQARVIGGRLVPAHDTFGVRAGRRIWSPYRGVERGTRRPLPIFLPALVLPLKFIDRVTRP